VGIYVGCVQKVVIPLEPAGTSLPETESEGALFLRAESLFDSGSYPESLSAFESFLNRFPRSLKGAAALMKIAAIHERLSDFDNLRMTYERLVATYPESADAPVALFAMTEIDYRAAQYERAVNNAVRLLESPLSETLRMRTLMLLGDTYMALGRFPEALETYLKSLPEGDGQEREKVLGRMDEAIGLMDNETLRDLMECTSDPMLKSRLAMALAENSVDADQPERAVQILEDFLEEHPSRGSEDKAKALLESLNAKMPFDREGIGCLLPLSGPYKAYGEKALRGIETALMDFVSRPEHPRMRLIIRDTHSDPQKTRDAVRELYMAGVAAIVGPIAETEAAAAEAENLKLPIITLTQKENIARVGAYVFRNFMTPRMQVEALVDYCTQNLGIRRFAVLYPEESYGKTLMHLFWDAVIARGSEITGVESYPVAQTDFVEPIQKLVGLHYDVPEDIERAAAAARERRNGEPGAMEAGSSTSGTAYAAAMAPIRKKDQPVIDFEALFIPDAPHPAGLILPQLMFYDVRDVYLLGTNLWHSKRLIEMAQKYAQGALMPDGFDVESVDEPVKTFVRRFISVYGAPPGYMEAVAYDSATLLFQTLKSPEVRSRSRLKARLLELDGYNGLTGLTAFNAEGDARKELLLFRIQKDRFVRVR